MKKLEMNIRCIYKIWPSCSRHKTFLILRKPEQVKDMLQTKSTCDTSADLEFRSEFEQEFFLAVQMQLE